MESKKCKVLGCDNEAISEKASLDKYMTFEYRGYCSLHAEGRDKADREIRKQDEELKEQEEQNE